MRLPLFLLVCSALSAQQSDPLAKALELADYYNWADSEPFFEQAKATAGSDARRALYAELGLLRATMERRVLPQASEWIGEQLGSNPLLQSDDELQLFAWMVRADIDFEIDVRPARRSWEQVRVIAQRKGDEKWIRRVQTELAFVSFVEGDVGSAMFGVTAGIAAAERANDIGALIRYHGAWGTGLILTKNYQLGLGSVEKALAIEAANQPQAGYNFPAREAKLMGLFGLRRLQEGQALASDLLARSRALQKKVKECQVLLTLGKHFRAAGEQQQARMYFAQARDLAEAGGFARFLAEAYNALAVAKASEGDSREAVELAARAAKYTQASADFYLLPDRLHSLARLHVQLGNREEARKAFEAAEEAANFVLTWASRLSLRSSLVNTLSQLYRDHFLLYVSASDAEKAYQVLESTRARTMRDLLAEEPLPQETAGKLRSELSQQPTPEAFQKMAEAFRRQQASQWTPSQRRAVEAVPLRTLQAGLGARTVLLEYALAEPNVYCVAITRNTARVVRLPIGERALTALARRYAEVLKNKGVDLSLARELYAALLDPVGEIINHNELLVSRDGALHLIPFEALVGQKRAYLVMTHEVSYIPSASTLRLLRESRSNRRPLKAAFLGIGGLPYDTSKRPIVSATRGFEKTLGNLPGSVREIRTAAEVAKLTSPKLLLGPEGTEGAFKKLAPEYRVIHLAVHGVVNTLYPQNAALVLLPDEATRDDGLLVPAEILQLRVGAELVVLSACDSGVGMLLGQDGIANLSRAFLAGGTRTVISTLWAAEDTAAANLLRRFYTELSKKATVNLALTSAKRDLIRTFDSPPYFWASYIVEGLPGIRLQ